MCLYVFVCFIQFLPVFSMVLNGLRRVTFRHKNKSATAIWIILWLLLIGIISLMVSYAAWAMTPETLWIRMTFHSQQSNIHLYPSPAPRIPQICCTSLCFRGSTEAHLPNSRSSRNELTRGLFVYLLSTSLACESMSSAFVVWDMAVSHLFYCKDCH